MALLRLPPLFQARSFVNLFHGPEDMICSHSENKTSKIDAKELSLVIAVFCEKANFLT